MWNTKAIVTKVRSLSVWHSLSQEFCNPGCVLADTCSTSETLQGFAQAQLAELSSETQEHRHSHPTGIAAALLTWRLVGGVSRADFPPSSMWRLSLGAGAMASVHPVICGKKASARQGEALIEQMGGRTWLKKKRGAHLKHMTVVRDMFQRYGEMTVMKETGGEGNEKKSLLAQVQGGRFISVIRLNGSAWGEMQKAPGPPSAERESRVKRSSPFPLPVHATCLSLTRGRSCPELPSELGLQRTAVAW